MGGKVGDVEERKQGGHGGQGGGGAPGAPGGMWNNMVGGGGVLVGPAGPGEGERGRRPGGPNVATLKRRVKEFFFFFRND
jgi:hypothetical protein